MFQVLARSSGGKLRQLPAEVVSRAGQQFAAEMPRVAARHFTALRRMLDREEPGYRD